MKGVAYGVGVGPGDPELMTLKACRLIRETRVIAVPGQDPMKAVAYQIAVQAVPELADKEKAEIAVIERFLPKQMGEAEVKAAIQAIIAETGATSMKDMGKVMGALKTKYAGQMDFSSANGLVKSLLS